MLVRKIPPSEQLRQEICSLLSNGAKAETNLLSELLRKSIQRVIQEALEQEVTDHLGEVIMSVAERRCLTEAIAMGMIPRSPRQRLSALTGRVFVSMSVGLSTINPGIVLVQGDTTTVFTSALVAFYQQIPVGHIEAGLGSDNIGSLFPKEMNRRLTTVMTDLYFAPTPLAKQALLNEGVAADKLLLATRLSMH